jgi:hypothetical protein
LSPEPLEFEGSGVSSTFTNVTEMSSIMQEGGNTPDLDRDLDCDLDHDLETDTFDEEEEEVELLAEEDDRAHLLPKLETTVCNMSGINVHTLTLTDMNVDINS